MTRFTDCFLSFESCKKVQFDDGYISRIMGSGSIKCKDVIFENVELISGFGHSVLSVCQLSEKGFRVVFEGSAGFIFNPQGKCVLVAIREGRGYTLEVDVNENQVSNLPFINTTCVSQTKYHENQNQDTLRAGVGYSPLGSSLEEVSSDEEKDCLCETSG